MGCNCIWQLILKTRGPHVSSGNRKPRQSEESRENSILPMSSKQWQWLGGTAQLAELVWRLSRASAATVTLTSMLCAPLRQCTL